MEDHLSEQNVEKKSTTLTEIKRKAKLNLSDRITENINTSPISIRSHRYLFPSNSVPPHGRVHPNKSEIFKHDFLTSSSFSSSVSSTLSNNQIFSSDSHSSLASKKKFLPNVNVSRQTNLQTSFSSNFTHSVQLTNEAEIENKNHDDNNVNLGYMLSHSLLLKSKNNQQEEELKKKEDKTNRNLRENQENKFSNKNARNKNNKLKEKNLKEDNFEGENVFSNLLEKNKKLIKSEGSKKSKNLLELSWKDEKTSAYTPISLPYVLKGHNVHEDIETKIKNEYGLKANKAPSVKFVDESNRNASAIFKNHFIDNNSGRDGENSFFHIQLPIVLPALDRKSIEKQFCKRIKKKKENKGKGEEVASELENKSSSDSSFSISSSSDCSLADEKGKEFEGKEALKSSSSGKSSADFFKKSHRKKDKIVAPFPSSCQESEEKEESAYMPNSLEDMPCGRIGKLKFYRNGNVKLNLGQFLFDVNPGSDINFAQEVGCILQDYSEFLFLGRCNKRLVVTPDIEHLMGATKNPLI